jgi:amino acid adenylation domain-containing protein/non-ribosomal peptide synthase protein (TIGR01720 family)
VDVTRWSCRRDGQVEQVPIGRPIWNTQIYVLGPGLELLPVGAPGELYIGGVGLARGYLRRAELTAERFIPDPYATRGGERLYRTGDVGRYTKDGEIEYLCREDEQVKIRGYRIELGEIETALLAQPCVRACAVVAREDKPGHKRLVAYIVPEGEWGAAALREALGASLPEYMMPSAFVSLDTLPLTPNGKLDRRALPSPDWTLLAQPLQFTPPRTAVEATLARIWAEALGVERVGVHDNFFNLGGDSILSIQIVSRAAAAGLRLTAKDLFQHQTVAGLGRLPGLAGGADSGAGWAEQGEVTGPVALTPIQSWFFEQGRQRPHHFNQAVMLRLHPDVRADWLRAAVEALVRHHDALRLRFTQEEGGTWLQSNAAAEGHPPALHEVDLGGLDEAQRGAMVTAVAEQAQRSLSLSEGPLLRAVLLRLGAGQQPRLLLVVHHQAVDGVSWRILLEDLQSAYGQLRGGGEVRLPAKTGSFQQWAALLTDYAASERAKAEAAYWREQPWGKASRLPKDCEGGGNRRRDARQAVTALSREQTAWLLQEAPAAYRTRIQDLLLTALAAVLTEWAGGEAVAIDLEGHGRKEAIADVTRTVGWFTSLYPVLLRVELGAGAGERIKAVKEQLRAAPEGGLAYGAACYLRADGGGLAQSGAEVVFNYLGQFDQVLGGEGGEGQGERLIAGAASEWAWATEDPEAERAWALEINGAVSGGRLELRWDYSREQYEAETVERLAARYAEELAALVEHCREEGAGGRTPSDFPLARLSQAEVDRLAGDGRRVEDIYPVTPMQQGLLFHALYAPAAGFYHQQVSCSLSGGFSADAFAGAWQQVIARHAILRTAFVWEGVGEPLQVVNREARLPVAEHDWRGLGAAEQAGRWARLLEEDRGQGFDLGHAPLMRLEVARVGEGEYWLLWSHHHLLLDGWCLAHVIKEVFAAYERIRRRLPAEEWEESRPYRDYIAWLRGQDLGKAEAYWRETLRGFRRPTLILERKGREHVGEGRGEQGQQLVRLTPEQTQRLQERGRREQVTMNTVLQGAWALLLSRYSGEADVVFGTTVSGRPAELEGVERMIGLFINTLPVRVKVEGDRGVWEWLRELQSQQSEMRQYEYSPLAQVQQWGEVGAGVGLFETLLAYENYPVEKSMKVGERVEGGPRITDVKVWERSSYPLVMVAMPGVELAIEITYERDRYDDESIERVGGRLRTILEEIGSGAKERVAALEMLGSDERRRLLEELNATAAEYPQHKRVHELFAEQAVRTPDAVAVTFGEEQVIYRELNERADLLAARLREMGVRPGALVGVFMKHSPEEIAGLLAILKAGGAYVPLEPAHPAARLAYIIKDAQLSLILTQQEMASKLPESGVEVICVDAERVVGEKPLTNPAPPAGPGDIAYVIYTSGSTGQPKGVSISHRALVNYVWWAKDAYVQDERLGFALYSSLAFDLTVTSIYVPLISGNRIVVHTWEGDDERKEAPLAKILSEGQTCVLKLTPSHLSLIKEWDNRQTTVRRLIVGGEALGTELARQVHESFGGQVEIFNEYGPTEATVGCMLHLFDPRHDTRPSVPIGRPAANVQVYVLDQWLQPAAENVTGELYIAGDGLAQGYLNRAGLTSERFVANPFRPAERMYRSGDLCRRLAGGVLEYLGRQDEQVKFHGYRVELNEIRWALKQHPQVRDNVVLITQGKNGHDVMVAYYVSRKELDAAELRAFLGKLLIAETIPNIFVHLQRLPLTLNGKVNYEALPSIEEAKQRLKRAYTPPRTPPEEILAGGWAKVLGLERVGIHDNFFDLGGHSLLATQLISRVREAFHVEVALRTLFEKPTVAAMAEAIEERLRAGRKVEAPPIEPAGRDGSLPLSFAQQRLWFLDQLEPGSAAYNVPLAMRLTGELKQEVLERTLSEIVRRHEMLRTSFEMSHGRPAQVVHPARPLKLALADVSQLDEQARDAELRRLMREEAVGPFDLSRGPLLRVKLLRTGAREHVALLTMHHIISDGWSLGIFVNEVAALYRAYAEGGDSPLPELEVQYADFALWQRGWLHGDALQKELDYWRRQLAGAPAVSEFPTDRPRPPVQTYHGKRASFAFPAALVESLKRFSHEQSVTLFIAMLTAFKVLLHRYTGQDDLVVGAPIAARNRHEIENVIGFFVNNLVLRTNVAGDPTFTELLGRVRDVFLEAYARQDVPFEKLVEELQSERDASRAPVFQVTFALQTMPARKVELPDLELEPLTTESEAARYDLTLWIFETESGLTAAWNYNSDLFEESAMKRIHGHYMTLLESIVREPEARLSSLEMLTEAERLERENQEEQQQETALKKLMEARRKSIALPR